MIHLLEAICNSFIALVYPPICLHCNESLTTHHSLFCPICLQLLTPIDPSERCPYCFSSEFDSQTEKCCQHCREKPPVTHRMAAVFDYEGPAATLIKQLKYGGQHHLAKGAGAYLTAQFIELGWPIPDGIIPMPMPSLRRLERGYNQSVLLAAVVAKLLDRPVYDILKRRSGDFSQAGLNHHQRLELKQESFSIKSDIKLYDKDVLLIDDVMTTGSSLGRCADALQPLYPKHIYALTVCRAL